MFKIFYRQTDPGKMVIFLYLKNVFEVLDIKLVCFDLLLRWTLLQGLCWQKPFESIYLHKEGTLSALIPGGSFRAKYKDVIFARVNHESIELLNYDGKNCNDSKDYNYDNCKQNYIHKVCLKDIIDYPSFSFPR